MNCILDHLIGFRTRNKRYMAVAVLYYICVILGAAALGRYCLPALIAGLGAPIMVFAVIEAFKYKRHTSLISIPICAVLFVLSAALFTEVTPESIILEHTDIAFEDVGQEKEISFSVLPEGTEYSGVTLVSRDGFIADFEGTTLVSRHEGDTEIYAVIDNTDIKSEPIKVTVADKNSQLQRLAYDTIDKINAIGTVTTESGELIEDAENSYNSLEPEVSQKVINSELLTLSRKTYDNLIAAQTSLEESEKLLEEAKKKEAEAKEKASAGSSGTSSENSSKKSSSGSSSENGSTVYIGKTGTKYHQKNCTTLKGNGIPISLDEALAEGRTPCKRCGG